MRYVLTSTQSFSSEAERLFYLQLAITERYSTRELQSLVVFELKIDKFQPEYLGQLEFYLEALDRDLKKPHENPSIGVLLCRDKDDEVVEYALSRSISPTVVAEYEIKLIPKEVLRQKLKEFYELLEALRGAIILRWVAIAIYTSNRS